jgi:arylsulfatase A-like enzyme
MPLFYSRITRTWFLSCYTAILALIFALGYFLQFDLGELSSTWLAKLFFLKGFAIETCAVIALCALLNQNNRCLRILAYAVLIAYLAVNTSQLISISQSGTFISRLAVENINHISLLINTKTILIITVASLVALLPVIICENFIKNTSTIGVVTALAFTMIITAAATEQFQKRLDQPIKEELKIIRNEYRLEISSPILAFINILRPPEASNELLVDINSELLLNLGIFYNEEENYPLIKPNITAFSSPFKIREPYKSKQPNIIIFFTEGLAARTTNVYSDAFKNLTPNIVEFSQHSMVIKNYYSHTAATYRGLHGQLCSIFPKYGGNGGWHTHYQNMPKTEYLCLHNILEEKGYQTTFLDTHRKNTAFIDELMLRLGFQHVLTAEDLSPSYLGNEEPKRNDALDDQQLYRALIGYLKEREQSNTPFFISMYNLETHAWQDTAAEGIKYADGKNNALNTIHNLDNAFGKFWLYFKDSSLAENTIVIFTSDHTHFTEKSYVDAIEKSGQKDYQKIFIDRIPFIIYDPSRETPSEYNARYSSSISFTPSLLHYLGYQDTPNPFVGHSFFAPNQKQETSLASHGDQDFWIDKNKIYGKHEISELSKKDQVSFNNSRSFIAKSKEAEVDNRLWKKVETTAHKAMPTI